MKAPLPFTVTALRDGCPPIRIGILATDATQATIAARELFPTRIIGIAQLEGEWEDDWDDDWIDKWLDDRA